MTRVDGIRNFVDNCPTENMDKGVAYVLAVHVPWLCETVEVMAELLRQSPSIKRADDIRLALERLKV